MTITVTATSTTTGKSVDQTFTVTVAEPEQPEQPEPMPDEPMATEETVEAEVEVDDTETVDASMYFTPDTGLTFSISDSDEDVATATVDATSGMVRITGVDEGEATIIVTATNATGSANLNIEVTVIAARPPHIEDIDYVVEIEGVGDKVNTRDIRTDADQTLSILPADQTFVIATRKSSSSTDTVWTLTGKKKTKTPVPVSVVNNADRSVEKKIMVAVGNTKPMMDKVPRSVLPVTDDAHVDKDGKIRADNDVTATKRQYHKIESIMWDDIFTDDDGDGDIKTRHARVIGIAEPYIKVVNVLNENTLTGEGAKGDVVIDVMKDVGSSFDLEVWVVDESDEKSDPVLLSVGSPPPRPDKYDVSQHLGDGNFETGYEVYLREGRVHTLTFANFESTDGDDANGLEPNGFRFVKVYEEGKALGATATFLNDGTANDNVLDDENAVPATVAPTDPEIDENTTIANYFVVTKSGPLSDVVLSMAGTAYPATTPTLMFEVTGIGRATVTITYHRIIGDSTGDPANVADANFEWDKTSKTLTINVVPSS